MAPTPPPIEGDDGAVDDTDAGGGDTDADDIDTPVAPEHPEGLIDVDLRVRLHPMTPGAEGNARAWLVGEDGIRTQLPSSVPAGDYLIEAAFSRKGSAINAGRVNVRKGAKNMVTCFTAIKECRS